MYNPMAEFTGRNQAQLKTIETMKQAGRWPIPEMLINRRDREYRLNIDDITIDAYAEAIVKQFKAPEEVADTKKQELDSQDAIGSAKKIREEQLKNNA